MGQVKIVDLLSFGRLLINVLSVAFMGGVMTATNLDVDSFLDGAVVIIRLILLVLCPLSNAFVAFVAKVGRFLSGSSSLLLYRAGLVRRALVILTLAFAKLALNLVSLRTSHLTN